MFVIVVIIFTTMACGTDDDVFEVQPDAVGLMKDNEGNEYKWVSIGGLDWMAENLKCGIPYYEQKSENSWGELNYTFEVPSLKDAKQIWETFGNYYSYKEALDNCPPGWRLPTDDDWKKIELAFGMSVDDADKTGWRNGAGMLMAQSLDKGPGLDLRYGGELCNYVYSDVGLFHEYDYGMYWTSTPDSTSAEEAVFIRKITPNQNKVQRLAALTDKRWLNVRYVRNSK